MGILIKENRKMGGGHGPHIHYNESNMKESDEEMQGKIQRVDLVKFNPNHFHMDFWSAQNMYTIFYTNNLRVTGRLAIGLTLGLALGYSRFGDRQRLHNAYVAERLRRRYPESMNLHHTDLWRLKGVAAPHEFYQWK